MSFDIVLAEERVKRQQVMALHLIVCFSILITAVSLFVLHYSFSYLTANHQNNLRSLAESNLIAWIVLIVGAALFYINFFKGNWLLKKGNTKLFRFLELVIVLCLAAFAFVFGFIIPAVIYAVIAAAILFAIYWESISDSTLYIHVNEKGIKLPVTSRRRFIQWQEVQQVLLRFGIITIDCTDNCLFQWHVRSINFDKDSFQRFCNEQIATGKDKRRNDW